MIYIANPFSHPKEKVRIQRYQEALAYAAFLASAGQLVYSPIVHGYPIAETIKAAGTEEDIDSWKFWAEHNKWMLNHCSALHVLKMPGWTSSVGVKHEIDIAVEKGTPVKLVRLADYYPSDYKP